MHWRIWVTENLYSRIFYAVLILKTRDFKINFDFFFVVAVVVVVEIYGLAETYLDSDLMVEL